MVLGGWMDGWVDGGAGLRIAYSNQKQPKFRAKALHQGTIPISLGQSAFHESICQ